jgi:hypothetical protein
MSASRHFVTLGMFVVDEFSYLDEDRRPTGKSLDPQERLVYHILVLTRSLFEMCDQIGGGGTYAAIGARVW